MAVMKAAHSAGILQDSRRTGISHPRAVIRLPRTFTLAGVYSVPGQRQW